MLMGVGEGGVVREGEVGDVGKFLNRILGLKVHQQNLVSTRLRNSPMHLFPSCHFLIYRGVVGSLQGEKFCNVHESVQLVKIDFGSFWADS